ncbi:MAG: hypothetical protein AB1450_13430 [Pseudomonadota bacterium]
MDESKKRIEDAAGNLLKAARKKRSDGAARRKMAGTEPPTPPVVVSGDGAVVGNNAIVHNTIIKTERHTTRVTAKPNPTNEHIDEDQVRRLHDLKDEILRLESMAKRDPATPQRVWGAVNKKVGVGSMRMIPKSRFGAAEKFLLEWIGRLTNASTVKKKDPDGVRKRRIAYIQTNMKKLGIEAKVRDYMEQSFCVRSLTDLPDAKALERVYQYVAGLKRGLSNKV